jgi:hypothetical protein
MQRGMRRNNRSNRMPAMRRRQQLIPSNRQTDRWRAKGAPPRRSVIRCAVERIAGAQFLRAGDGLAAIKTASAAPC